MKPLEILLARKRRIRVVGFDDAPFARQRGSPVGVAGVVCADTRMEGMLWGRVTKDGLDATEVLCRLLGRSKFYEQIHLVLIDGLAVGGFNLIDLPEMAHDLARPCVAVMRAPPDLAAVKRALSRFEDAQARHALLQKGGEIHHREGFYFQVAGAAPDVIGQALPRLTDRGRVPEALRLAHLIGRAVILGESGRRA
ncbi:MAG: DUF99 family protein [Deltaproteobacteria bacterium]|nr:MAG: DUF99 family protein [Deltaproteobacteria bacterium]